MPPHLLPLRKNRQSLPSVFLRFRVPFVRFPHNLFLFFQKRPHHLRPYFRNCHSCIPAKMAGRALCCFAHTAHQQGNFLLCVPPFLRRHALLRCKMRFWVCNTFCVIVSQQYTHHILLLTIPNLHSNYYMDNFHIFL